MPHWWEELTAIPHVGDVKKLAQKIHASFNIPAVQCEALGNQEYIVPPWTQVPKGMFLPDSSSYHDIWLKPHIFTLAYAQVLQHWVEEAHPLTPGEHCLLAMSMIELKLHIGIYTTFSKHDVFEGLGNAIPEAVDEDRRTPPADSIASPSPTDVEDTQLSSMADDTISPFPVYKSEAESENTGNSTSG